MSQRERITQQQGELIDEALEGNKAVHDFFHSLVSTGEMNVNQVTNAINHKHEYFEKPCKCRGYADEGRRGLADARRRNEGDSPEQKLMLQGGAHQPINTPGARGPLSHQDADSVSGPRGQNRCRLPVSKCTYATSCIDYLVCLSSFRCLRKPWQASDTDLYRRDSSCH